MKLDWKTDIVFHVQKEIIGVCSITYKSVAVVYWKQCLSDIFIWDSYVLCLCSVVFNHVVDLMFADLRCGREHDGPRWVYVRGAHDGDVVETSGRRRRRWSRFPNLHCSARPTQSPHAGTVAHTPQNYLHNTKIMAQSPCRVNRTTLMWHRVCFFCYIKIIKPSFS